MFLPLVLPRMKKRGQFPCQRIDACDVWPFVVVAMKTYISKVLASGPAPVLVRNYMVNLEGCFRITIREQTILTPAASASANEVDELRAHTTQAADFWC